VEGHKDGSDHENEVGVDHDDESLALGLGFLIPDGQLSFGGHNELPEA